MGTTFSWKERAYVSQANQDSVTARIRFARLPVCCSTNVLVLFGLGRPLYGCRWMRRGIPEHPLHLGMHIGRMPSHGNSAECCGVRYDYAQGYEWGGLDCSAECGLRPARRAGREEQRSSKANIVALKHAPDFETLLSLAYQAPRIVFVPNSCTREYDAIFENFPALPKRGI